MGIPSGSAGWDFVFASALPETILDAKQIAEMTGIDEGFLIKKVGVHQRHVLAEGEQALDLAEAATRKALERANLQAGDLDGLIYVTQNPDYILPQSSALLSHRLGCRNSLCSFDLSLGCSGWVYAITIAAAMADAQDLQKLAIVTCDTYTPRLARDDKATMAVFGDAAAATLLLRGGDYHIGKGVFGTDGSSGFELSARGGELNPQNADKQIPPIIRMNGRSILEFMLTRVPDSVNDCLLLNNVNRADIDCFAFHQASEYMVRLLIREMDLDEDRVPLNINLVGNTVSSTIPMLLEKTLQDQPSINKIIVSGFGVGLSWATNYIFKTTG